MQERTWLTGAQIKWIAMASMLVDHIGAAFLEYMLLNGFVSSGSIYKVITIYKVMRYIGRFAFPTFCFLLVEGFFHTSNRAKYLRNLIVFAVISEIPFDWALFGTPFDWSHQNVFLTLAAGFLAIWLMEYLRREALSHAANASIYYVLMVLDVATITILTEYLHTDYGALGVAVIVILYVLHNKPIAAAFCAWMILTLLNSVEIYALPFVLAVCFYNGQRGKQAKYFFYVFYPLHLFVLAVLKLIIF